MYLLFIPWHVQLFKSDTSRKLRHILQLIMLFYLAPINFREKRQEKKEKEKEILFNFRIFKPVIYVKHRCCKFTMILDMTATRFSYRKTRFACCHGWLSLKISSFLKPKTLSALLPNHINIHPNSHGSISHPGFSLRVPLSAPCWPHTLAAGWGGGLQVPPASVLIQIDLRGTWLHRSSLSRL